MYSRVRKSPTTIDPASKERAAESAFERSTMHPSASAPALQRESRDARDRLPPVAGATHRGGSGGAIVARGSLDSRLAASRGSVITAASMASTDGMMRDVFDQDVYREALNRHYGKLLKMSRQMVGQPSEREQVMLGKIRKLEKELDEERQLAGPEWDPVRARVSGARSSTKRDRDIQVNIYALETSMQSVATMDAAFAAVMKSAVAEVDSVEKVFENRVSIGAPNFKRNRRRRKQLAAAEARKSMHRAPKHHAKTAGLVTNTAGKRPEPMRLAKSESERKVQQMQRITGGTQLPHVHLVQKPATHNATWGFPVFTAPGDYGPEAHRKKERAARAEMLRTKTERLRMQEEEEEQKAISRLIESEEREADYEKFVILADRFGALDGELFCMSRRPGKLYEHLVYASATLIQIWWKIMWPHRKEVMLDAVLMVQRVFRGKIGRDRYTRLRAYEDNVAVMLRRIMNRAVYATFSSWQAYTVQQTGAKKLIRKIMRRVESMSFTLWSTNVREIVDDRNEKLRKAMARMLNKRMYACMVKWQEFWQKNLRIKSLMRRQLMGLKGRVYEEWRDYTRSQVRMRREHQACLLIQRSFRGHSGRKFFRRKFRRETRAAVKISRIVRGHLGRQRYDYLQRQEQQRVRRMARTLRRESMRQQMEQLWKMEKQRIEAELEAMKASEPEALRLLKLRLKERAGSKEFKAKTRQIRQTFAEEHHDRRSMTWRVAKRQARAELEAEAIEQGRAAARAEFRKARPMIIAAGESLEQVTARFGGSLPV